MGFRYLQKIGIVILTSAQARECVKYERCNNTQQKFQRLSTFTL